MYASDYGKVLTLNNVGIALLERGSYAHAVSTFKYAVRAIEAIASRAASVEGSSEENGSSSLSDALDKKVQRAYSEAEHAYLEPLEHVDHDVSTVTCLDGMVMYPMNRCLSARLRSAQLDASSHDYHTHGYSIEKAIIYSNFGLSSYLFAKSMVGEGDEVYRTRLLQHSRDMLKQASLSISDNFGLYDDDEGELKVLAVALLVTGNMVETLKTSLGVVTEADEALEAQQARMYQRLREALQTLADPEAYTSASTGSCVMNQLMMAHADMAEGATPALTAA
jgi:tetratricopeptide (TPR) repeat protein